MILHPHFLWKDLFKDQSSPASNLINNIRNNVLFSTLDSRELKYLAQVVYERTYQLEEPIFQQNDRGLGVYLITKGQVEIRNKTARKEVLVTTLTQGSFFGEIALVDPTNVRTASAIAKEHCSVIGFFKPDLNEILERKPSMGVKILLQLSMVLGRRLYESTEKITELTRSELEI
jgi:CRP-like cAMP-binding protein